MMQTESKRQAWLVRVQEQAGSGLGIRAWCVREGLTESTFHYWRKRVSAGAHRPTAPIALPQPGRQEESALEVMTPLG